MPSVIVVETQLHPSSDVVITRAFLFSFEQAAAIECLLVWCHDRGICSFSAEVMNRLYSFCQAAALMKYLQKRTRLGVRAEQLRTL